MDDGADHQRAPLARPLPSRRPRRPWWQRLRWDRLAIVLTPPLMLAVIIGLLIADDSPATTVATGTTTSTTSTTWRPARTTCRAVADFDRHQKLAQLIMVTLEKVTPDEVASFTSRADAPGGLFFPKFPTDAGAAAITGRLASYPGLAAIDDEGGRVNRLNAPGYPSPRRQTATMSLAKIKALGAQRAAALKALGINMDLAPVVDVSAEPDGGAIGDRSYSDDPKAVIRNAGAFAAGLRSGNVLPTLKHFPGHGRASGDSHTGVVTTPSWKSLQAIDVVPYPALAKEGPVAVMVGHLDVPGLTEPNTPASLSPAAYRALRTKVGFTGLAITDDIGGMGAVTTRYSTADAVAMAIEAGADLALIAPPSAYDAVLTRLDAAVASGQLPASRVDDAFARVRSAQGCPG